MHCRDAKNKATKQEMKNPRVEKKGKAYFAMGTCAKCGGGMSRIVSKADAEKMM